jgi:hypothetical protein
LNYYKQIDATKTATIKSLNIDKKAISDQLETKQEAYKILEEKLNKVTCILLYKIQINILNTFL